MQYLIILFPMQGPPSTCTDKTKVEWMSLSSRKKRKIFKWNLLKVGKNEQQIHQDKFSEVFPDNFSQTS
jgi:hypothetical protein